MLVTSYYNTTTIALSTESVRRSYLVLVLVMTMLLTLVMVTSVEQVLNRC